MKAAYDTIVFGGGSAGITAASQAARAGAHTLLVEKNGMLGGTTTIGGVNFPGLFHAWGKQIIAGIGWEIIEKTVRECGGQLPDFTNYQQRHWRLQIPINKFVYAALCDEAVTDSGADVLFHAMPATVHFESESGQWQVSLCTKTGLRSMTAKVLVDATADANVTAMAGFPIELSEERQPSTLSCYASGYDIDSLDLEAINEAFEKEVAAGRLSYTDASWNTQRADIGNWLKKRGENASHIHGLRARTSEERSQLELEARRSLLRLVRFLHTQPGLENLQVDQVSPECGVRETATMQGKKTITVSDYTSGRVWEDALCYSFYPIDLHTASAEGLDCRPLEEGVVPTIPRGAMLPRGSQHFIVAGRCISSDRLANSALRVQASCMAMGQAAGAMAALCSNTNQDPENLPVGEIHDLLRRHNAIVPTL